jgi:hypothetical protein
MSYSLAKKGHNESRASIAEATCRCSCTTVVYYCRDMLEEPLVRAVINVNHTVNRRASEVAPASRYDGTNARRLNRVQDNACHTLWVVYDDAAEAYVNRCRSAREESIQVGRGFEVWRFPEYEARNILTF